MSLTEYKWYLDKLKNSPTEMFWYVPSDVVVTDFKFDIYFTHNNEFDRKMNHVFLNNDSYDGIMLLSKHRPISKREFEHRFPIERKEWNIVASVPKLYDIIFISYNEPTADENYKNLCDRFPRAKRVHGVNGIHQAHIEAAKLSTTSMFFVVDGDAVIVDDFNFEFDYIPYHKKSLKETVYVWRSKNPVNNLEYGYGGVKLLPRELTLNVDVTSSDMTTSISDKFCMMNSVSNVTAYNTDDYSIWRSAFRECVKLSSKSITGQVNDETDARLSIWQTVGPTISTSGALSGTAFGLANKNIPEELRKINDYNWLYEQFSKYTLARN